MLILSVFLILVVFIVLFWKLHTVSKKNKKTHSEMLADILFTCNFSKSIFPINKEIGNINRKLDDLQVEIDILASSIQRLKGIL